MKIKSGAAALAGVLVIFCALVAWEWYSHVGKRPAGQPVQEIAAATPAATLTPTPTPAPAATPTPTPRPGPVVYVPASPSAAPATAAPATPAPAATASPSDTPTPYRSTRTSAIADEPMAAATLSPRLLAAAGLREPPDAPPRILAMSISTPVAHGGDVVSGTVRTTSNVASVEARIAGYSSSMRKIGVGLFTLTYRVPNLPFFLHRTYTIEVIARNTRGDAVRSAVPITIR